MTVRAIFEGIDRRIRLDREDSDSAYFQALTLKLEYLTKLVTAGVLACVGEQHGFPSRKVVRRSFRSNDQVSALEF